MCSIFECSVLDSSNYSGLEPETRDSESCNGAGVWHGGKDACIPHGYPWAQVLRRFQSQLPANVNLRRQQVRAAVVRPRADLCAVYVPLHY